MDLSLNTHRQRSNLARHYTSVYFLAPFRPLASRQGVLAFLKAQMLALHALRFGRPAVIVTGLVTGTGQARKADVIVFVSAA